MSVCAEYTKLLQTPCRVCSLYRTTCTVFCELFLGYHVQKIHLLEFSITSLKDQRPLTMRDLYYQIISVVRAKFAWDLIKKSKKTIYEWRIKSFIRKVRFDGFKYIYISYCSGIYVTHYTQYFQNCTFFAFLNLPVNGLTL